MLSICAHNTKWECPSSNDDVECVMVWGNSDSTESSIDLLVYPIRALLHPVDWQ